MNNQSEATIPSRLISIKEVQARTSLSRATIWRKIQSGDFPMAVRLGAHRIAWREVEVATWIDSRSPTVGAA